LSGLRIKYKETKDVFTEASIERKEPMHLFKKWMQDALSEETIFEPNAMCLATVSNDGFPSTRYLLLKGYDEKGFTFFTNYESRKAKEMVRNSH
jgi:pyridoxamine 5'-phosphate oxidase